MCPSTSTATRAPPPCVRALAPPLENLLEPRHLVVRREVGEDAEARLRLLERKRRRAALAALGQVAALHLRNHAITQSDNHAITQSDNHAIGQSRNRTITQSSARGALPGGRASSARSSRQSGAQALQRGGPRRFTCAHLTQARSCAWYERQRLCTTCETMRQ
eukprot:6093829-Prymnesium_polylepis.1